MQWLFRNYKVSIKLRLRNEATNVCEAKWKYSQLHFVCVQTPSLRNPKITFRICRRFSRLNIIPLRTNDEITHIKQWRLVFHATYPTSYANCTVLFAYYRISSNSKPTAGRSFNTFYISIITPLHASYSRRGSLSKVLRCQRLIFQGNRCVATLSQKAAQLCFSATLAWKVSHNLTQLPDNIPLLCKTTCNSYTRSRAHRHASHM